MSAGKGRMGLGRGAVAESEWVGWQPLWSTRRIHFHLCFVPTNFELLSAATKQNQRQRQAPAWQDMLLPVCLPVCLPRCLAASLPRGMSWQEASKCILQQQQQEQSAQTLPLFSPSSAQSHTCIQYAYSLVWSGSVNRRHPRTVSQSEETSPAHPPSSLPNLPLCHTCLHFLLVNMSVSLHHHRRHQRILRCFYLSACLSLRPSVCLSILLSRFAKPSTPPPPPLSTHHSAPLLSCSQLLLQHLCCPARVLCKLCSLFSSS